MLTRAAQPSPTWPQGVRIAALRAFQALPEQERVAHAARIVLLLEDPYGSVQMAALKAFHALPEQESGACSSNRLAAQGSECRRAEGGDVDL